MAEVFGRVPLAYGGAFSADAAATVFGGAGGGVGGGVGLLTQQLQFSYRQRITRVYEVGSRFTFYIAGRSEGDGSMARILGPRPIQFAFYLTYGNPCAAGGNSLIFWVQQGCAPVDFTAEETTAAFALNNVVLHTIAFTVAADNMIINEQTQFMYISLTI